MGLKALPVTKGWRAVFGCTYEALAIFRITLGALLLTELILRFRFLHPFYSDEGTHPMRILRLEMDDVYNLICLHCLSGSMIFQEVLLGVQTVLAALFMVGYQTRITAVLSWGLYLSLTLRNTWLNFILDRYFHYLLFYAMFLPLDRVWSLQRARNKSEGPDVLVSMATICLKLQVTWIYLDAGGGKWMDPLGGWTYWADPLPALDTYARHTVAARYMYALLRPEGLRLLTPTVVYVELLAAPLALLGSYLGNTVLVYVAVGMACSLHIGIALTVRNTVLLSLVACCAWCAFLPQRPSEVKSQKKLPRKAGASRFGSLFSAFCILTFISGSIWFETMSAQCDQSMKHIWSTLLHNRWNVFVGAEEYVTWEIAPGLLEDGSVVDVWGRTNDVNWDMPGTGAPCTSTARPGRWRSFPYLAELEGEQGYVLWNYLCKQWDWENDAEDYPGRKLIKFNFFMLQADVLPDMGFSATRKRLIHSHECESHGGQNITTSTDNGANEAKTEAAAEVDDRDTHSAEGHSEL